jgi:membrane fusion protein (multidrug efflux system)
VVLAGSLVSLLGVLGEVGFGFVVPQGAVQRDAKAAYVLVVGKDGKVARKDIVTERGQGADWVVREGVAEGDQVIVSGLQRAVPGQPAKAAPVPPAGQAPAQQGASPAPAQG